MKCRLTGGPARDQRRIAVSFSFLSMTHIALRLESAQYGEDRGVREVLLQVLANLRHGRRPLIPKDGHHVELAFRERHVHVDACYEKISNTRSGVEDCQLSN